MHNRKHAMMEREGNTSLLQGIYPGEEEINESGEAVTVSSVKSPRSREGEWGGEKKKGPNEG